MLKIGNNKEYLLDIGNDGFPHSYMNIDDRRIEDELHARMRKAGLDTSYYLIPAIHVNSRIMIRPAMKTVHEMYSVAMNE